MNGHPLYILLIEDDEIDREIFMRCLSNQHYQFTVVDVTDAIAALATLHGEAGYKTLGQPYIIVLDLYLPGLSGFEFLRVLRQDPDLSHNKVFVLTSSTDFQDEITAADYAIAGYLIKDNLAAQCSELINFF